MKIRLALCALLIAALMPGCAKEKQDKIIPGYNNPGPFRPKGVLDTKEITFAAAPLSSINCPNAGLGEDSEDCLAVYANWLATRFIISGFAISDKNRATPTYNMKVTQGLTGWKITLIIDIGATKGVKYEKNISRDDFTVDFCKSCEYALPRCTPTTSPACDEEYEAEGGQLVRATITFINTITLENAIHGPIVINIGDQIVAQAYNISVDNYCVPCP